MTPALSVRRGVAWVLLATNLSFFFAISSMPLADASAVVFIGPLLITALSVPLPAW